MYLTQMGEIPLLTRAQEISHAKKIELTRGFFRKKLLECALAAENAVQIFEAVQQGNLAGFQRVQHFAHSLRRQKQGF